MNEVQPTNGSDLEHLIARNRESGWVDLSEREKAFAVEYTTNGFKHKAAAESVGLSDGLRQLRKPLVGAFIAFLQESSLNAKMITQSFVEQKYLELLPKLMGEEEIPMVDLKTGETFHAKKLHSAEVVSVLRDLGKSSGYIAPEIGPGGSPVQVNINMGDFVGVPEVVIEHADPDSDTE